MLTFFLIPLLLIMELHTGLGDTQGEWHLLQESIGISAMHMQLLKNNRVVIFDRTDFGPSNISIPNGVCRHNPNEMVRRTDCTAHSVLYNIGTNTLRALTIQTDTWCSSGAVLADGSLLQTGGYNDGDHTVRTLTPCGGEDCDWVEFPQALVRRRWYSSNQILANGDVIIVGGRGQYNYEFYPRNSEAVGLDFLRDTRDESENNLYPFLHLLPDGNLFIFANMRSILFDYKQTVVVKEFPVFRGGDSRNYPSSGSSVLLPVDENVNPVEVEIMICGGASEKAFAMARQGTFMHATGTCGRLRITGEEEPDWKIEHMPMPRVMGDMLILPNGDLIILNGAGSGTAGWENARDPVTRPVIYRPSEEPERRFSVMISSARPRLYHSSAVLLTDGRVLVGGSNPHAYYNFTGVDYPTDLSLESFSPPYLSPEFDHLRPGIITVDDTLRYKTFSSMTFTVGELLRQKDVSIRLLAPPFATHSFSMNQRMIVLNVGEGEVSCDASNLCRVNAMGPSTVEIAPPGYYLLFVVHGGIPSSGRWVKIQQ